jgi:hypothetical protein
MPSIEAEVQMLCSWSVEHHLAKGVLCVCVCVRSILCVCLNVSEHAAARVCIHSRHTMDE